MKNNSLLPLNTIELVKNYLLILQNKICFSCENIDKASQFHEDQWLRPEGGGGITRVLSQGQVFSKAAVNFSHVCGTHLPETATITRKELQGCGFNALGVSVVIHPENPYAPTAHANVRFFVAEKTDGTSVWWFGGGFDLTPYYGFVEDCKHWHQTAKTACTPFGEHLYPKFKKWCDNYFFLKHRNEARGIGGLFFDDFNEFDFHKSFAFMQSIGDHFLLAYQPIIIKRKNLPYGDKEKAFQLYRRGRYVEFNLLYDRGTLFGLQSGGRTESILVSLPPEVTWKYTWQPEKNSPEEQLYTNFLPAKDWLQET